MLYFSEVRLPASQQSAGREFVPCFILPPDDPTYIGWNYAMGRIIKANLSWSRTRVKFCQLIASLPLIRLQLKLTKFKLEVLKSDFQHKKKGMITDEPAVYQQNFARVRLQLKFAFIIRPYKSLRFHVFIVKLRTKLWFQVYYERK